MGAHLEEMRTHPFEVDAYPNEMAA
jgi:hypothetical protein